jgi:AraC family transcriptional regulator of adaptative response / DNA-3-methyladenine glycosylase II
MELDDDACYEAFVARDLRFDGRLFVGVKTTGIYCRPVCPARIPKRANVLFYTSAAAAQEAGFRPCLRCRPETSPGVGAWCGTSNTVARALAMIDAGALDEVSVNALSERLGVGERHLRRLFLKHIGASPITVAQTRRVLLAKQLIHETSLSMTEIAIASGFGSLRRFNETFLSMYRRPPSELRRNRASVASLPSNGELKVLLRYRPPYDWDRMLASLAKNAIVGVESVHVDSYARSFDIDGEPGMVCVRRGNANTLEVTMHTSRMTVLAKIIVRMRRLFDLTADPEAINAHLRQDPLLADCVEARPGLRIAGSWDSFETSVRALLEYRLGPDAAQLVMKRLALTIGAPIPGDAHGMPEITRVFPSPELIARAELAPLGLSVHDAATLTALAAAVADDANVFGEGSGVDDVCAKLCQQEFDQATAGHIALRVLRQPDAFLATDPRLFPFAAGAERWRPWRAYAAQHLIAAQYETALAPGSVRRTDPGGEHVMECK